MPAKWKITEHYPDGLTWRHWAHSEQEALWVLEELREAHKGRRYEIEKIEEEN